MHFIQVKYPHTALLQQFIEGAGTSLQSFRYFQTRPLTVIENHICTFLLIEDNTPIAYGHLDVSDEATIAAHCGVEEKQPNLFTKTIWLGIAVSESQKGRGFGKLMIDRLLYFAKENAITQIKLSVDNNNTAAIKLYEKVGFVLQEKKETFSYYKLGNLTI
ncbi:MAG: GNAT family N-acetyltransferase [Bacteroidia bacterium]